MIALLVFLFAPCVFSSTHISNCPDSSFTELGAKFPAVGRIFSNESGFIGTGTLINTNHPKLTGRVVLTCTHNLEDLEITGAFFHLGEEERKFAHWVLHPKFSAFTDLMCFNAYDIALCLLDAPLDVEEAEIDLDLGDEEALGRMCTTVGYGNTGHYNGLYSITDNRRRASHSFSGKLPRDCYVQQITDLHIATEKLTGEDAEVYLHGNLSLSTDNTSDSVPLPHGITGSGDSGGPIFSDGKIIAIVNKSCTSFKKIPLITLSALKEFDGKYKAAYTESFSKEHLRLQARIPYLEECVTLPLREDEVDTHSVPITVTQARKMKVGYNKDYDSLSDDEITRRLTSHEQENVLLSIHKKWILGVLAEFAEHDSRHDKK